MELADVLDSKSSPGDRVRVRPPPPAPSEQPKPLILQGVSVFFTPAVLPVLFFADFARKRPWRTYFGIFESPKILCWRGFRRFRRTFARTSESVCLLQQAQNRVRGFHFWRIIQMGVYIGRGGDIAVSEPFLNVLHRNLICEHQRCFFFMSTFILPVQSSAWADITTL